MEHHPLSWLFNLLAGILYFVAMYVVIGYGMDLAVGGPRNPVMDRSICAAALMGVLLLGIQFYRRK
ncbi:MAG: hypothetical protein PHV43_01865 [Candidatus Colwellbacteria bacterium]|nr:hypothetical protein [Candidatus Colwellbacteria bacterium]